MLGNENVTFTATLRFYTGRYKAAIIMNLYDTCNSKENVELPVAQGDNAQIRGKKGGGV